MTHTDIKTEGIISYLPKTWRPYLLLMRIDRPIGWWLLLLPGWWSIALASGGFEGMYWRHWYYMVLFFFGAILMRGAGCIVNDIWDKDLDAQVERTRLRPIAAGVVEIYQAYAFLFFILFTGLIILLQMPWITFWLGVFSLVFIGTYPYMKRITWWPQAFLGITFNFGALMGWSAITSNLSLTPVLLYAACVFWTLGYDTVYAHQDKKDDALIGIKSTALLFGKRSKIYVAAFYTLTMILLVTAMINAGAGHISLLLMTLPAIHLIRQMMDWRINSPESALKIFKSNRNFGLLVLICMLLSGLATNAS